MSEDWDAAAVQLTELQEISPEHPQLQTFRQRISEGDRIALMAAEAAAGDDAPPPAENPANDAVAERPPAAAEPDPQTVDDPPPAEENPPAAEDEAEPAPVGETRPPERISGSAAGLPRGSPFALAVEGDVTVQATIDVDGNVVAASVQASLDPFLDEAAINTVLQWKLRARFGGRQNARVSAHRNAELLYAASVGAGAGPTTPRSKPHTSSTRFGFMAILINGIDRFRQAK